MSDPEKCEHLSREDCGIVLTSMPEIYSWTCKDCGLRGHTEEGAHYTHCFCCEKHNVAIIEAWQLAHAPDLGGES